jgi:hypothetical protein
MGAISYAGYDFAIIDMEHSILSLRSSSGHSPPSGVPAKYFAHGK